MSVNSLQTVTLSPSFSHFKKALSVYYWLLSVFLALLCSTSVSYAKEQLSGQQLIEYLNQEKSHLAYLVDSLKQTPGVKPYSLKEVNQLIQQNKASGALNTLKVSNLENFLLNQNKLQENFIQQIKLLQKTAVTDLSHSKAQQKIEKINTLHQINKNTIALLHETVALAQRYQRLLRDEAQHLELWKARLTLREELNNLHEKDELLIANLEKLYDKSIKFQQNIKAHDTSVASYQLEANLLLNNQLINLTQFKRTELKIQRQLAKANFSLLKSPDVRTLQVVTEEYKSSIARLSDIEQSLRNMSGLLKSEQAYLSGQVKTNYETVLGIINSRIENLMIKEQTLQEDLENHQSELKKQLASRTSLTEYRVDNWPALINQIVAIPKQTLRYLTHLSLKVVESYQWIDTSANITMWLMIIVLMGLAVSLHGYLNKKRTEKERSRLSGYLYEGALIILSRNLPHLTFLGSLFIVMYSNRIMFSNYQLLVNLIALWIGFRSMILVARLSLLERLSDYSGSDVRLYYRLKWLLLAGGWTTGLMVFSQLLPLAPFLQDLFSRVFMLFLAALSIVIWRSKEVILHLFYPVIKNKRRYLRTALMVLVLLLPLTLFSTALIGLIGYINLAWTMSHYQFMLILLLSSFVLLRGMLFDALELASEWMITSLKNGWLWVEVWLKPLDKLLRLTLVITTVFAMFKLFGWHADSWVVTELSWMIKYPLIDLSGIHITPLNVINFLILIYFFGWASKWTREFGYRWLYRKARDSGIRNSLSVFTQYAVILIGTIVTLRALGFDFSGLSMVLGGLAVGMGFGLRDFASNVIGGLMLLIERPVREGDIITLGEYEGTVSHIGIRTMRISSWDNMDVLVPNAETFSKPFTNWTHQDSIVRTVLPIKVSRADDPLIVQQLILDVLALIPEIVPNPPSQVFLKQIDDALISFEIRYYINVQLHNRFEVRSKVLFAIMEQFKTAGIKAPIPPVKVEMQEPERETARMPKPTEK